MQILRSKFLPLCRPLCLSAVALLVWVPLNTGISARAQASAQQSEPGAESAVASTPIVPQQVRYAGKLASHAGVTVEAQFRIYASAEGGEPLWTETQRISIGEDGSYTVLLGSGESRGLPQTVFAGGVARWLGVSVDGAAEPERALLASVPYAMKSADAEALAGHAASDFVTQEQLAALTAQGERPAPPTSSITPLLSGTITGSGTAGNIAQFTGANTIGNSEITQVGSDIGINVATPTATLDVGGTTILGGAVTLPATGPATTATGTKSELLQMQGSTWSSTTSAPVAQTYTLSVNPANNNTATPSSDLVLQYASGTSPATNLFYVNSNGQITFAPTQTFPGTLTSVSAASPLAASTNPSGAVSLSLNTGTLISTLDGYFPRLTLPNTFANSEIFTSTVTIDGALTAASNLSVGGTLSSTHGFQSTGSFVVEPTGPATSSTGVNSALLELGGSAYSSTLAAAVAQNFAWQNLVTGNDTASPSSKLALLYGSGTTAPAVTGLYIAPNGQITFAPGQTFPVTGSGGGTITGITTSSPLTGSGTTGSVALGLDTSALETTLNNVYAQLGTGNTFSSYLVASQTAGPGQAALLGRGTNGSIGTFGSSDTGYGLQGVSTSGFGVYAQVAIPAAGSAGVLGSTGTTFSTTYSSEAGIADAGVWADNAGTAGSGVPVALFATADNAYGGAFMNNSAEAPALFATNGTGPGAQFTATAGNGVYGQTSGGGNGVEGFNNSTGEQQAGVEGVANVTSTVGASYNVYGGVWGDTGTSSTAVAPAWAIGVLGTADDSYAGVFLNNSANFPTLFAENYAAGGATGLASGGIFKTFMATSEDGTCGIGRGGSLSCTGQIKSLVSAGNGARTVETYAPQSAENWMEDYGTGTMEQGVAVVKIDLAFAETASETPDYHVFITPNADSKGLYVINKTATSFEVRESGGGVSSLTFDYKIVAKRRGYEAQRLVDVTERFNTEMKARSIHKGPAAVDKPAMPLHATLGAHLHPLALQQLPVPLKQMDRPANAPTKP